MVWILELENIRQSDVKEKVEGSGGWGKLDGSRSIVEMAMVSEFKGKKDFSADAKSKIYILLNGTRAIITWNYIY